MSNRARIGVVVFAVAVVVVAFVALKPGSSSNKQDDPASRAADTSTTAAGKDSPTASVPLADAPPYEITLKGGTPDGGVKTIKVKKGDKVRLQINTDEPKDTLHLHGYDIEKDASAKTPANFQFTANVEGVFELESHTAEDAGREPLIARLAVEPN